MEKVVITGIGTINSIALNAKDFSQALKEMKSGIDFITQFETQEFSTKIAAEVKGFVPEKLFETKIVNRYDRFLLLGMAAAREAVTDAGLDAFFDWRENAAVTVSSGIGGFKTLHKEYQNFFKKGPRGVRPFLIPMMIADMCSGAIAIDLGLRGPNFSVESACASSLHAIILTAMMIQNGFTDIALTGGSEAVIDPMPIAAFGNMTALSSQTENPQKASRPFDSRRDGFVMGEGAGVLVLESESHAQKRGARIYGYIEGVGMSEDAYHISQTDPDGYGAFKTMTFALKMAGITASEIDLINCHATSTPVGDASEVRALKKVFGDSLSQIVVQSTKTLTGHTLGASGAIELIACILQTDGHFVHGMPNLEEPDPECANLWIPRKTIEHTCNRVLKNAFGFGGHNASVIYKKN